MNKIMKSLEKIWKQTLQKANEKIKLGRMMTDIVEEENMNISFLPKDMQETIDFYEKFGQPMEKRDIQWKGWQQKVKFD